MAFSQPQKQPLYISPNIDVDLSNENQIMKLFATTQLMYSCQALFRAPKGKTKFIKRDWCRLLED